MDREVKAYGIGNREDELGFLTVGMALSQVKSSHVIKMIRNSRSLNGINLSLRSLLAFCFPDFTSCCPKIRAELAGSLEAAA